jgi:pyridoxal biosynthesis lyase PdxS
MFYKHFDKSNDEYSQSDPQMIKAIVEAVTIPVMAKVRIGHFVEAQILQAIGVGQCSKPSFVHKHCLT